MLIVSMIFVNACKKETLKSNKILENEIFLKKYGITTDSNHISLKYKNNIYEYTSVVDKSNVTVDLVEKDATIVKNIIDELPNAVALILSKDSIYLFDNYDEYQKYIHIAYPIKHPNSGNSSRTNSTGNSYAVAAQFFKHAYFNEVLRTEFFGDLSDNGGTVSPISSYQTYVNCAAGSPDTYCPTGQYYNAPGFSIPNIGTSQNDQFSSIRISDLSISTPLIAHRYTRYQVICFENANYGGLALAFKGNLFSSSPYNVNEDADNLTEWKRNVFYKTWNDQISSIKGFIYFQ